MPKRSIMQLPNQDQVPKSKSILQSPGDSVRTAHKLTHPVNDSFDKIRRRIRVGDYDQAANLLSAAGRSAEVLSAHAVCLMRSGNAASAVRIYRSFVLQSGCTWERAEVSSLHKRNFATALLLSGHPFGCQSVLRAIGDNAHPRIVELDAAIHDWAKSLPFWRRVDWWINGVEPHPCNIALGFEPGEFDACFSPA